MSAPADQHLSIVGQDLTALPPDLAAQHPNLTSLDLSHNLFTHVAGLEALLKLKNLVVDNNALDGKGRFARLEQLTTLCVNSNSIGDLKEFVDGLVEAFPSLTYLSMLKNPACPNYFTGKDADDYQRYRLYVLHRLPRLTFLDSTAVTEAERKEAARVGHLMLPAKAVVVVPPPADEEPQYEALPQNLTAPGAGQASFGKSRYTYHGKQSEGNRFILNKDL